MLGVVIKMISVQFSSLLDFYEHDPVLAQGCTILKSFPLQEILLIRLNKICIRHFFNFQFYVYFKLLIAKKNTNNNIKTLRHFVRILFKQSNYPVFIHRHITRTN